MKGLNHIVYLAVILVSIVSFSCKPSSAESSVINTDKNTLSLKFNPKPGSVYNYTIENKTELEMEMQGKKTRKNADFDVAITYSIARDTAGNYLFESRYEKIRLVTKDDDVETISDAGNANAWSPLTEKMLGALKESRLVISVAPGNNIKILSGYEELSNRLMSGLDTSNISVKQTAQAKIDEIIKKGLIERNVDQLFRFFPDSAMRVGSKWKVNTKEQQGLALNINTSYALDDISGGVAYISSKSSITSDKTPIAIMGYNAVPELTGEQEGIYEVEAGTCMLLNASVSSSVKGSINLGESAIPVSIRVVMKLEGKRL
ncbi:MAG TPA: DUF6263 family protein [Flavisolibacter sp.]|nr:DUF6263 family protein [Flavisolibacter sp.]